MTACICQRGPRTTCPVHGADVSALLVETEQRHRAAGYFDPVDEATALRDETERLRSALATAIAERDAARAEVKRYRSQLEELTWIANGLKAAGAWKPEEVWREEVADEVAELSAEDMVIATHKDPQ